MQLGQEMSVPQQLMHITLLANQFRQCNQLAALEKREEHIDQMLTELLLLVNKKWQLNDSQKVSFVFPRAFAKLSPAGHHSSTRKRSHFSSSKYALCELGYSSQGTCVI